MTNSIERHFGRLPDPRRNQGKRHQLSDMILIAVCAVICAADDWHDVEDFGHAKLEWLGSFMELPHGIPSHDTFERLFARLDPDAFEECFMNWTRELAGTSAGKLIALDGKTIRHSFEQAWNRNAAAHLVSVFATANRTVLGQLAVQSKENELAAMRKLLELLDLKDATVTIDAMGCQKDIAATITDAGGDYVLAVKDNQPSLHSAMKRNLDEMILQAFQGVRHGFVETVEGDHGRIETRRVWTTDEIEWLPQRNDWPGLASMTVVEATRQDLGDLSGKVSIERRYFISSIKGCDAQRAAGAIRGHWGIENNLHWQLDVSFGEDMSRMRKGHSAQNFSRLRRIALNLLRRDKSRNRGIKGKRLNAAWNHDYLLRLLTG